MCVQDSQRICTNGRWPLSIIQTGQWVNIKYTMFMFHTSDAIKQSTCRQTQSAKFPTQKADFLNGVTKWLVSDGECVSDLTWFWMAVTITLKSCFSQSLTSFFKTRQKRERRRERKTRRKKQLPFWRVEWLCVGELAVDTKMKRNCHSFEILQSKLTFYLRHCQRKAEKRWVRE